MEKTKLDVFTTQYIRTALWSSTNNDDEPLDVLYSEDDIDPDSLVQMIKDCKEFQTQAYKMIKDDLSQAGHDFWLTRNRHGAGFWDGDWEDGDKLTEMSNNEGEVYLYVGDNGKIHYC